MKTTLTLKVEGDDVVVYRGNEELFALAERADHDKESVLAEATELARYELDLGPLDELELVWNQTRVLLWLDDLELQALLEQALAWDKYTYPEPANAALLRLSGKVQDALPKTD